MSLTMDPAAVMSRIDSIQSMISQLTTVPSAAPATTTTAPATTTAPTSFAAQLQSATAAPVATMPVATLPVATTAAAPVAAFAANTIAPATSALPASVPYGAQITAAAQSNGIDPALLAGLIKQESGFDPTARSGAGAVGLTQLMPGTAASLGVTDATDPTQAIDGGARYLAQQLKTFGGDASKALAAYNAGPGAVTQYGGVPPYAETQNYVRTVLANADQYRGAQTTA